MRSWNFPGAPVAFHRATQSFVRTNTRYFPALGNVTVVAASFTGAPIPCAMRYGEPMPSMNCVSSTQPPGSRKLSASTSRESAA